MMMGRIVIACYRPKPDQSDALRELLQMHHSILESQGLVTRREPIVMAAADGTVVEVFEWISNEAIEKAHRNPVVAEMWEQFDRLCDHVPVGSLSEAEQLFSEFTPISI